PYDLVDGTYLVSVKSTDEHGNYVVRSTFPDPDNSYLPSPFQLELKKDSVSPTNSSSLTSSLPILTTSPYTRISSSVSDALSGVERSTYGSGAQEIKYDSNPAWLDVHTYYNYISISEGNIDYYVDTYDRAQNKLTQTIKIIVDTTEPVVSSKEPQGAAANSTPVIISEYNDLGSITKGSRLYLDGAYLTSAGLNSNMISFTPAAALADGTHTSTVYVEDILGNFVVDYWNFYVNNEGPTVNITHPQYFLTFTRNASIDVSGTTPVTGNVSLDVNAVNNSTVAGPDFNFVGVPLNAGLNNIRVEADGDPAGDQNNTFATKWVIRDNSAPSVTINSPTAVAPQNVRSGFPAYITFTYNELYPASYNIKLFDGATLKNQAPVTINNANVTNVKAGGTHQIMGAITIPSNLPDGLYDINITMIDLAGNVGSSPVSNDIIRVKNTGPSLTNETPANNAIAIPTAPIKITIKDTIAGVDRNSIRMFIYGQSYSNSSVINMEVTDSLDISPVADGYEVRYKPSWPWENTNKINVSVEATDKIGNKSSMSWYYITTSNSPVIDSLSMENHRIAEGEDAYINLVVSQCSNEAITYDAIKEINITVGKLGKIVYVPDGAGGNAKLVRTSDSLPGSPSEITVSYTAGGCSGGNLFRYSFTGASRISFKVPEYAGDVSNRIFVTTVNDDDWESYSETYLITSKQKYIEVPNTYYYGKYSWLPTFQGLDLSIGRVSNEPVGTEYEIYGQTNDAHRMIPVGYAGWTKERIAGNIVTEQWSGILYIDNKGDKIQWDHGRIPTVFEFDPDASTSQTWPPGGGGGPPFLPPDWLTLSMDLDLATRQYNIQKYSLENPIVNILPDEFAMCAHGYFDITDTGWANSNVLLNLKSFPKILQERGDPPTETLPPGLAKKLIGGSVFVPQANGGPVLLVKERRNIYDSLEACIVVTTMDLDRYKNNRNTVNGKDMHPSEVYSGSARDLEENIIVYACGHELIID
ncbi:MAG: hypothetical protein GYA51_19135, partial [Candidatus Methanofastidiosa archaeon]|nr:hypothetical protein [Candidatus Methanofastidiosa archaeon]